MFPRRFNSIAKIASGAVYRQAFKPLINTQPLAHAFSSQVTIEEAKKMPKIYNEMPNDILLSMAVMGDQEAREERLIREIMAVDNVDW
jgi:hypothetical protein